ncbi:MAG: hypothetical protein J7577_13220 [Sphingobacteriaceae bacterium]|nr:hypothetical protein [Sphingobacteriaceae bacterium]
MKKLLLIALALVLISSNGCRILKHKKLDKKTEDIRLETESKIGSVKVDSVASFAKGTYSNGKTTVQETISYKSPQNDNIELTANFKVDGPVDLRGDTAFKLVDVKNKNVSVTVFQNKKTNELTARIKTDGKTKDVPFNEMLINRTITHEQSAGDTTKTINSLNKLSKDSTSKVKSETKVDSTNLDKTKNIDLDWKVWIGITIVFLVAIWFFFFRK